MGTFGMGGGMPPAIPAEPDCPVADGLDLMNAHISAAIQPITVHPANKLIRRIKVNRLWFLIAAQNDGMR